MKIVKIQNIAITWFERQKILLYYLMIREKIKQNILLKWKNSGFFFYRFFIKTIKKTAHYFLPIKIELFP